MEALIARRNDTVLRVIDIKNWTSAVAKQHRIAGIPQLWLYDGTKLVTKDPNRVLQFLAE